MKQMPLITIAIASYNEEYRLADAIKSALSQDYANIEVIVVDDASEDMSPQIALKAQKDDPRVKVILHNENKQLFEVRRTCVNNANGEYLLFLDADDYLPIDACNNCIKELKKDDVDILHYSVDAVYHTDVAQKNIEQDAWYFTPEEGFANGKDIVHRIYTQRKGPWCIWGKLYRTQLLKDVFADLPERRLFQAEDSYTFFAIANKAESYHAVPSLHGYYHRIEEGYYGRIRVSEGSINGLISILAKLDPVQAVLEDINRWSAWNDYKYDYRSLERNYEEEILYYLDERIYDDDKPNAVSAMAQRLGVDCIEILLRLGDEKAGLYIGMLDADPMRNGTSTNRTEIAYLLDGSEEAYRAFTSIGGRADSDLHIVVATNAGAYRHYQGPQASITTTAKSLYDYRARKLASFVKENEIGVICLPSKEDYPYRWDEKILNLLGCFVVFPDADSGFDIPEGMAESTQPAAKKFCQAAARLQDGNQA